jgi:hypothetical protein
MFFLLALLLVLGVGTMYMISKDMLSMSWFVLRIVFNQLSQKFHVALRGCARKIVVRYILAKEHYMWRGRKLVKRKYPIEIVWLLDWIFAVAQDWYDLHVNQNIMIQSAFISRSDGDEEYMDITKQFRELWISNGNEQLFGQMAWFTSMTRLFIDATSEYILHVEYIGHSNPLRHVEAQPFTKLYRGTFDTEIVFPPYKPSEVIKRGLGVAHITNATLNHDGFVEDEIDVTDAVKKAAGLKQDFYKMDDKWVLKQLLCPSGVGGEAVVTIHTNRGSRTVELENDDENEWERSRLFASVE